MYLYRKFVKNRQQCSFGVTKMLNAKICSDHKEINVSGLAIRVW